MRPQSLLHEHLILGRGILDVNVFELDMAVSISLRLSPARIRLTTSHSLNRSLHRLQLFHLNNPLHLSSFFPHGLSYLVIASLILLFQRLFELSCYRLQFLL